MSLKTRIEDEKDVIHRLKKDVIPELRRDLWEAEHIRKNDERWEGESQEHWQERKKRNRHHVNHREDRKDDALKKLAGHVQMLDDLRAKRVDFKQDKAEERKDGYKKGSTAIVVFDGKPLVEDLAYWLQLCRDRGLWNGYLVSGYRSPEFSQQLCFNICGRPSCPGLCAGLTSNHTKLTYPGPAADVTDYIACERALFAVGAPYSNNLPNDLVHMSRSGH